MTDTDALRAALERLFAEHTEADLANRVGKGDKTANLLRLIAASQAIDAALATQPAGLDVERLARAIGEASASDGSYAWDWVLEPEAVAAIARAYAEDKS